MPKMPTEGGEPSPSLDFASVETDMIESKGYQLVSIKSGVDMKISDGAGAEPPRRVDGVVIHAAEDYWALGEVGPYLVVVWRGQPTESALLQVNERIADITQRRPGNCAFVTIIERNSPAPPPHLRKLAIDGLNRPGKALTCKVAVIEGNELRSALTRAVLTGMVMLRPQAQPTKFFKNTQEMVQWVKTRLPEASDLDRPLVQVVEVVRSEMPT